MLKSPKNRKYFIWLPYTSEIDIKGKDIEFIYKGGTETINIKKIHSLLFYGHVCPLSQELLELFTRYEVPITIHRRNMPQAVWITPSWEANRDDLLTKQVIYRENERKRRYIARRLLYAKFKSMEWLVPSAENRMQKNMSVNEMQEIEAWHARKYWDLYYEKLGFAEFTRRGEASKNKISEALDAVSKFISGVCLRWVTYHNLSPYHGYLHEPSSYPALVYDLMEPMRGYAQKAVFEALEKSDLKNEDTEGLISISIEAIKEYMDKKVYVNATRQIVTVAELYHGAVLALRAYLLGEAKRFIVPIPGTPNGGRPVQAGYKLYGRSAGKTDFWVEARKAKI